jgi:hypothetical protein
MDKIIQSMENFLTTVPRFLASDVGRSLVTADSDEGGLQDTFVELEAALLQMQAARLELDLQRSNPALRPGNLVQSVLLSRNRNRIKNMRF